jgi:flagellar hook assembly protein FlgD
VTSVEGGSPILPVAYSLQQNYPNPFNPTTTIEYRLGRSGDVTLEVFNALGQRVLDLALGHQAAGPHRVSWDGRDRTGQYLPSGVYFYRLSTGDFEQTKKMVLMK